MPMYKGTTFKDFLIDRYAMGFNNQAIREEFLQTQGLPITDEEMEKILEGCEPAIRARESELLKELMSKNVFTALYEIKTQLDEVRQEARDAGDFKTYAQLTNSAMESIKSLIATTEKFKQKAAADSQIHTQNNILVINVLEEEGALKILDKEKLVKLIGEKVD